MNAPMYAGLFLILLVAYPFVLPLVLPYQLLVFIVNGGILANVWYQCSSRECGFFYGLCLIPPAYMSGCANISLLYVPFILLFAYCIAVYYSIRAFWQVNRRLAQAKWIEWVIKIGRLKRME